MDFLTEWLFSIGTNFEMAPLPLPGSLNSVIRLSLQRQCVGKKFKPLKLHAVRYGI